MPLIEVIAISLSRLQHWRICKVAPGSKDKRREIFGSSARLSGGTFGWGIDFLCLNRNISGMTAKTMSISVPGELKAFIDDRVRSGLYGSASDVIRAGLRALTREEMGASIAQFEKIMSELPQDPITPEVEQEIVEAVHKSRAAENRKAHK
jgi:antitoxin ParD1/3/4